MLARTLLGALGVCLLAVSQAAPAQAARPQPLTDAVDTVGRQTVRQLTETIGQRVTQRDPDGTETPEDEVRHSAVWAGFAYQSVEIDGSRLGFPSTNFEADLPIAMVGADRRFRINDSQNFVVGMSVLYTRMLGEVTGSGPVVGEVEGDIWTFAPYFGWSHSDHLFISLAGGYQEVSRVRNMATVNTKSDVGFLELAAHGAETIGIVEGKAMFGYRVETGNLHTAIVEADLGPRLGIVKPFVRVRYEGVFGRDGDGDAFGNTGRFDSDGHSAFVGGGITCDVTKGFAVEIRGWSELGISGFDNHQGVLTLTGRF